DIEYKQTIRMAYHNGLIELSSIENCDHIDILNIYGQKVLSSSVTAKNIDVPHFSKGIYICALAKQGKLVCTRRIIVK
ncbi:T9SS type A sorting domain-containing protein, partial [Prevotella nigrescens]|uniref:T9SS type A sorting domain-containing protein n=1 Tax=Prevotella nigrescens TaxID=28133 RepID=UPI0036182628